MPTILGLTPQATNLSRLRRSGALATGGYEPRRAYGVRPWIRKEKISHSRGAAIDT